VPSAWWGFELDDILNGPLLGGPGRTWGCENDERAGVEEGRRGGVESARARRCRTGVASRFPEDPIALRSLRAVDGINAGRQVNDRIRPPLKKVRIRPCRPERREGSFRGGQKRAPRRSPRRQFRTWSSHVAGRVFGRTPARLGALIASQPTKAMEQLGSPIESPRRSVAMFIGVGARRRRKRVVSTVVLIGTALLGMERMKPSHLK